MSHKQSLITSKYIQNYLKFKSAFTLVLEKTTKQPSLTLSKLYEHKSYSLRLSHITSSNVYVQFIASRVHNREESYLISICPSVYSTVFTHNPYVLNRPY